MAVVKLTLPHHAYEVHIQPGALARLGELVKEVAPHEQCVLMHDADLPAEHPQTAGASLTAAGYRATIHAQTLGEANKHLDTVRSLYDVLLNQHLERKSPVIALGGGVAGDTIGFVAASYLRGVPFVQCPTTLLAMVDASVGGKVGVNVPQGKNLVGAFYQPQRVVIDTDVLSTLPLRELRGGLAECVKHGVIRDAALFDWISDHVDDILSLDSETLVELVRANVQIKTNVVMADEKEAGERAHLNFGHTFGHAIEATQGYGQYHHGEAVSLGMVAAGELAVASGRCDRAVVDQMVALLDRIGLPTKAGNLASTDVLMASMLHDKKVKDGQVRLVLPDCMGAVSIVTDTPADEVAAAWETIRG